MNAEWAGRKAAVFTVGNINECVVGQNGIGIGPGQIQRNGRAGNQSAFKIILIDELSFAFITPV